MVLLVLVVILNYIIVNMAAGLIIIPFAFFVDSRTVESLMPYLSMAIMLTLCGLALTPMGETFFRFLHKAREPLKTEQEKIEPIFVKIVESVSFSRDQFDLLVCDDQQINAYAMGRRSVIITRGAMRLPDNEI